MGKPDGCQLAVSLARQTPKRREAYEVDERGFERYGNRTARRSRGRRCVGRNGAPTATGRGGETLARCQRVVSAADELTPTQHQ